MYVCVTTAVYVCDGSVCVCLYVCVTTAVSLCVCVTTAVM